MGSRSTWRRAHATILIVAFAALAAAGGHPPQATMPIDLRGHTEQLYVIGPPRGDPVIVASGDGGWIHLGPHVAEFLGARGFYVLGLDVKAYLTSFTTAHSTLQTSEEPGDFRALARLARDTTGKKPILIGVSEGAGLSVLAATDRQTRAEIAGVIGLGLPDINELGWRWKDSIIYLTHGVPREPSFSAAAVVSRVTPLPLAAIHSTHDDFVPVSEVERIMAAAGQPKRLWVIPSANHRFSDNLGELEQRLLDAIAWVKQNAPPP